MMNPVHIQVFKFEQQIFNKSSLQYFHYFARPSHSGSRHLILQPTPRKQLRILRRSYCQLPSNTMKTATNDAAFLPIWEEEDLLEIVEEPADTTRSFECDKAEVAVEKSKARTAVLAHEAECSILELQRLLGKTSTGTSTHAEKDRLLSLNSKLSALKKDIKDAKTIEKDAELELLKSRARSKVTEVKLAMKEKDIRRALHAVQSAESVDVAFIIDCTGSMSSYIASVKDSIQDIVERIEPQTRISVYGWQLLDIAILATLRDLRSSTLLRQ